MNNYQLEEIKINLEDYLQRNGVDTTKPMFRCLICGSSDACHIVPNTDGKLWMCFSANHSKYTKNTGDIFEYVQQLNNVDFSKACKILQDIYLGGHTVEPPKIKRQEKPKDTQMEDFVAKQIPFDISLAIEHADENRDYLLKRGISVETQKRYNIGFIKGYVHPKQIYEYNNGIRNKVYPTARVIIPTSNSSYLARAIYPQDEGENSNFKVLKAGETYIFNADILKENIGYCFCFEGEIDALSGIECGFNSIGLGSTSMIPKLFKEYPINHENVLIIAMDNDKGGKNSIAKFETLATANKIPYIVVDSNFLFNGAKDCNQALQENRQALTERLNQLKNEALKLDKEKCTHKDETQTEQPIPSMEEILETVTFENIKSDEILKYSYNLPDETQIAKYFDKLIEKAINFHIPKTQFNNLIKPFIKEAKNIVHAKAKKLRSFQQKDGIKWDIEKDGRYSGTFNNYENILTQANIYKQGLKFNEFDCKIYFDDETIDDNWISALRLELVRKHNFSYTSKRELIDAVNLVARYNKYHPVKKYFNSLPSWDNTSRVETLFIDYLGADDNQYTRKIARITLISAIARIFQPGCYVDTITCLVGEQGIGKSKFLRALAVNPKWFSDSITSFDGKEFYENIQGFWINELGEGTAFKKSTKEIAKQRAIATKDIYRTPYAILPSERLRQCIFIATVNDYTFLKDETGNRRYYPIDCDKSKAKYSFNDLTPDILTQIWAEAYHYYKQGELWYLTDNEKNILAIATEEQKSHYEYSSLYDDIFNFLSIKISDDWYTLSLQRRRDHIRAVINGYTDAKYQDGTPWRVDEINQREFISIKEIWVEYYGHAINEPMDTRFRGEIRKALKELGYVANKKNRRVGGYGSLNVYEKN